MNLEKAQAEVETLRKVDTDLEKEMKDFLEDEHRPTMRALSAAYVASRDGIAEKSEAEESERKLKALKERKVASGVALAKARETVRLEQLKLNDRRKGDIASEGEALAGKIKEQLQSASSSSKRLRTLCNEYITLSQNDKGTAVMLSTWLEAPEAIDRTLAPLPAKTFATPQKLIQETGAWISRLKAYA